MFDKIIYFFLNNIYKKSFTFLIMNIWCKQTDIQKIPRVNANTLGIFLCIQNAYVCIIIIFEIWAEN